MIEYKSLLTITCENSIDNYFCWAETTVQFNESEKKEDVMELLESLGWEFMPDETCVCPYCSKGIKESTIVKSHLRRVK